MGVMFIDWVGEGLSPEWEFISSTTARTSSITLPSAIESGDLLVILNWALDDRTDGVTTPTAVTPTGFLSKVNTTFNDSFGDAVIRFVASVKIANGTESSDNLTTMNKNYESVICLQFRPVNFSISSVVNITLGNKKSVSAGASNPSAATSEVTGIGLPAIAIGIGVDGDTSSGSAPSFTTQSPAFDDTITTVSLGVRTGYRIQNSSVTAQEVDIGDNGSGNILYAFQLYDAGI